MNFNLLIENLTNPALLFFVLGVIAVYLKSDLEIPDNSSKFISLYLLFAIGFKGGQELSHEVFSLEIGWSMLFGLFISIAIPLYTFFILKKKFSVFDAGAIAATYGSVSAVTFVTAVSYLEAQQLNLHGYMVAIMALMESPAIIMGLLLIFTVALQWQIHREEDTFHIPTEAISVLCYKSELWIQVCTSHVIERACGQNYPFIGRLLTKLHYNVKHQFTQSFAAIFLHDIHSFHFGIPCFPNYLLI